MVGSRLTLRAVEARDVPALGVLRRDRSLQHRLMGYPSGDTPTDDDVRAWIERRSGDPTGCFFAVADAGDRCIGFTQLTAIHRKGGHAYFGVALDPGVRGQGYGAEAVSALIEHGQKVYGCRKILAEVRSDNEASHKMCRQLGFSPAGTLKRHYFDFDVTLYERLL